MTSGRIRILQISHLAMLALVPLLFTIFRMVSEQYDPSRALVENIVIIGGGILSGYTLIILVITGKSEDALPGLVKLYRKSLSRVSFLVVSDILLGLVLVLLMHQLLFFRQVEFLSPTNVELYLGNKIGKPNRLCFVRALTPAYIRLSIGQNQLVIKDSTTNKFVDSLYFDVPDFITDRGMLSKWINPRMEPYEKLD